MDLNAKMTSKGGVLTNERFKKLEKTPEKKSCFDSVAI